MFPIQFVVLVLIHLLDVATICSYCELAHTLRVSVAPNIFLRISKIHFVTRLKFNVRSRAYEIDKFECTIAVNKTKLVAERTNTYTKKIHYRSFYLSTFGWNVNSYLILIVPES